MRPCALLLLSLAAVGCSGDREAAKTEPPAATETPATSGVDGGTALAAPAAPCAGMWSHADPAWCMEATGKVKYMIHLVHKPVRQASEPAVITIQMTDEGRHQQWVDTMVSESKTADEYYGRTQLGGGDLPAGKWLQWGETRGGATSSVRFRAVVHFGGNAYQCEVYWGPKSERDLMVSDQGDDMTAAIEACKSMTAATDAAGCAGKWSQPDPGFCMIVPGGLAPQYQIYFPELHSDLLLNVFEDEAAFDRVAARMDRNAADHTVVAQGEVPGGRWIHWRAADDKGLGRHELGAVQRFGGHTYDCQLRWQPKSPDRPSVDRKDRDVTAAMKACTTIRAPR